MFYYVFVSKVIDSKSQTLIRKMNETTNQKIYFSKFLSFQSLKNFNRFKIDKLKATLSSFSILLR